MSQFQNAKSKTERMKAFHEWDLLRKKIDTWDNLTMLRFWQDTQNLKYKAEQTFATESKPDFTKLQIEMKEMLINSEHRSEVANEIGEHAFRLWEMEIKTFQADLKQDIIIESKLEQDYIELMSSAKIEIDGKMVNMSGLGHYCTHENRSIRHEAQSKR